MHDVNHALSIIKEKLDLPVLELNADGQAEIALADGFKCHVTQVDSASFELSFQLPHLAFADNNMLRAMMAANFLGAGTGAGRLGYDLEKGDVIYCERWDITAIDARNLERKFAEFLAAGTYWLTEGGDKIIAVADPVSGEDAAAPASTANKAGDESAMMFRL